jgi:8-oxo-dGTP pyrophosphatase MutT (NUDIX family)
MPKEVSAGAVIFRRNGETKYLLLHYESGHWDFPRGAIELGENEKETVVRETREETGITDLVFLPEFREKIFWFYKKEGKTIYKEAIFYLAETKTEKIILSSEHIGFAWMPYEESLKQTTFKNGKEVLRKAHDFLIKHNYV